MGGGEIIVVLLAALLLFGADKMPEIVKDLVKGMGEFRKVSNDLKREFNESTEDIRNDLNDLTNDIKQNAADASKNIQSYVDESEVAKDVKDIDNTLKG
ncbi:MAG: twin-arginine translocase TatA/TatE family subunit [Bacteroidales bacterium]|nr:twin-arginine translocase TatA/TatE family subunit [Bacteroidales bacterium]